MKSLMAFVLKGAIVNSIILIVLCAHTLPASAHAMLLKAEPARRGVLTKAPTQVRLWFNEEIESAYVSLSVLDANKKPVTETKPHVVKDDPRSIILPLPNLLSGKYSVKFRVLSVDGHVVDSSFDYTVKNSAQEK